MNLSEILNIDYPVSGLTVSRLTSVAWKIRVCKKQRSVPNIFNLTHSLIIKISSSTEDDPENADGTI